MSVLLRREGGLMAIIQSLGCFCFSLLLLLLLWTVTSLCVVLTSTAAVVEMVTKHRVEFDSVRWRYCPCTEWSELRVWQCTVKVLSVHRVEWAQSGVWQCSVVWWCVQLLSIIEGTISECWCCDGACSCCQSLKVLSVSADAVMRCVMVRAAAVNRRRHQLRWWTFLETFIACSLWHNSRPTAAWVQRTESCFTGLTHISA